MIPFLIFAGVVVLMAAGIAITALIAGWHAGTDGWKTDQAGLAVAAYQAGRWLRARRDTTIRGRFSDERARTEAFYAALDKAVKDELHRKDAS